MPPTAGASDPLERVGSSAAQDAPVSETDSEDRNLPKISSRATRSGRRYIFIDRSADPQSSNEAIRVHVMREAHRARRQLRDLRKSESDETRDQMTILQSNTPPTVTTRASSAFEGKSMEAEAEDYGTATIDGLAAANARPLTQLRTLAEQCKLPNH